MKYIRTKDGKIFNINEIPVPYQVIESWLDFNSQGRFEIIKYADTIEELCDEFVCVGRNDFPSFETIKILKLYKEYDVRGAIWTDKGLIYVAKMNDKGCLELL